MRHTRPESLSLSRPESVSLSALDALLQRNPTRRFEVEVRPDGSAVAHIAAEHDLTIKDFCAAEQISEVSYFELRKRGLGPTEFKVLSKIRITPKARLEWRERMHKLANGRAAKLERARMVAHTQRMARAAVASPRHVSKRKTKSVVAERVVALRP
jgi:hypothetical protein